MSLLYGQEQEEVRLAPLYDLVSTIYYPDLSKKMAKKIGGEYLLDKIFPRHFEQLVEEAGLAKPLVKRRVSELAHDQEISEAELIIADTVGLPNGRFGRIVTFSTSASRQPPAPQHSGKHDTCFRPYTTRHSRSRPAS